MILPRTPLEDAKVSISSQLLDQNVTKEARHNIAPIISRLPTNRDTHGPSITTHLSTDSSDSSNTLPTDQAVSVPPEFPDLALPEYIESSFQEFDMDELLEADLALSEHDERELTLDSVFASSSSSENQANSRESSFANTSATSGEFQCFIMGCKD